MVENTKHRQILKKVSMPHRELHTLSYTEAPFRCSHTFFKHTNKRFCFAMNNASVVALFGHIALDGTRDQLQKRCRVCGSLLVAKGKKRRAFYQCSEFKECLFRAFSIDINNDLPDIHPVSLCYSCKQIMDRPMTCYSSTAITEWERFMLKTDAWYQYQHNCGSVLHVCFLNA